MHYFPFQESHVFFKIYTNSIDKNSPKNSIIKVINHITN